MKEIVIPNKIDFPEAGGLMDKFPTEKIIYDSQTRAKYVFWICGSLAEPKFTLYSFYEKKHLATWEISNDREAEYIFNRFMQLLSYHASRCDMLMNYLTDSRYKPTDDLMTNKDFCKRDPRICPSN